MTFRLLSTLSFPPDDELNSGYKILMTLIQQLSASRSSGNRELKMLQQKENNIKKKEKLVI